MQVFFHHVGQSGARVDFPKTVYQELDEVTVQDSIPDNMVAKYETISMLRRQFPEGRFNCWGVPAGAKSVIRRLSMGDCVLLVEKAGRTDGEVPVLCEVKVYLPVEFPNLSKALWGSNKFPYIFFFDTERIALTWPELRSQLGYSENYDPRGRFYSVKSRRFNEFGGEDRYVMFLRQTYI